MHVVKMLVTCLAILLFSKALVSQPDDAPPEVPVIFGGDAIYPPFEWIKDGRPAGFHIELEAAIAEAGDRSVQHYLGPWPDMVEALETGRVDILPMLVSPERQEKFLFSTAIHNVSHAYYARPGSAAVQDIHELEGKKIALERLSYAHNKLGGENIEFVLTDNTVAALRAVSAGQADYAILATAPADHLLATERFDVARIGPPFWPQEYAFAVRKDRPALAAWLQESLNRTIRSGQYQEIYSRWKDQIEPSTESFSQVLRRAAVVIGPLVILAVLGWLWSVTLRRTVQARTIELHGELDKRIRAEEKLRHFADHDALTGLPEGHHFVALASDILVNVAQQDNPGKEVALLKLAELEDIIQTFGYDTAKQFVSTFAERLKSDDFDVAGYLGRGIFVLMSHAGTLEKRLGSLSSHIEVGGLNLCPQMTVGYADWPEHGAKAEKLVQRAETALAVAMANNWSQVRYEKAFEPDEVSIQLVTDFRDSNAAGIFPVLQPQIELATGRIVAAEALVRWQHPKRGLVPPSNFIPALEKAGLIGQITHRMIEEANRVGKTLAGATIDCAISVNISARDVMAGGLTDLLLDSLMRYSVDPGKIKLELTETSIAEDMERVCSVLKELESIGIKISVDDFGTGYSSLSYLSAFPIHELKVDQSFVQGMARNRTDYNIVSSTIALGHSLGLKVVAEGAEDEETVELLKGLKCDRVQGYVFAKPMAEDEFLQFAKKWDCRGVARAH